MEKTSFEPSKDLFDFLRKEEGEKFKAYLCPAGIWTIGVGITRYPDGQPVKPNDTITQEMSNEIFGTTLRRYAAKLSAHFKDVQLTQGQINALVSFVYNVGWSNFLSSTLYKKVKANPADPSIRQEFQKWVYASKNGKKVKLPGLIKRRKAEADLYFS